MGKYLIKSCLLLCLAFVLVSCSSPQTIDLFVLAGQSNMQGMKGDASRYPVDEKGLDERVQFYWKTPRYSSSQERWTFLHSQGGIFPAGHFGPEITLARSLADAGYNTAIFKYSLGGTSLANQWRAPGEGGLYDKMVLELRRAVRKLSKDGRQVVFRGFVWVQGESDSRTEEMAEAYGDRLRVLIKDFRFKVARDAYLPIVLGVDEQYPGIKVNPQIVQHQQQIAMDDIYIEFSSMKGLEKADRTHLTPDGLAEHGVRLYEAFKRACSND